MGRELDQLVAAVQNLLGQQREKDRVRYFRTGLSRQRRYRNPGFLRLPNQEVWRHAADSRRNPRVQRLIKLTGVGDILSMYATVADAAAG